MYNAWIDSYSLWGNINLLCFPLLEEKLAYEYHCQLVLGLFGAILILNDALPYVEISLAPMVAEYWRHAAGTGSQVQTIYQKFSLMLYLHLGYTEPQHEIDQYPKDLKYS